MLSETDREPISEELIKEKVRDLSKDRSLDPKQMNTALRKLFDGKSPSRFHDSVAVYMKIDSIVDQIAASRQRDNILSILNDERFGQMYDSALMTEWLNEPQHPFLIITELRALIDEFTSLMKEDKEHILQTGYPRFAFYRHAGLHRLAPLYYTRIPLSIKAIHQRLVLNLPEDDYNGTDTNEETSGDRPFNSIYSSLSPSSDTDGEQRLVFNWPDDDYQKAAIIEEIPKNYAIRLEGLREIIFELKVKVLDALPKLLATGYASRLWKSSAEIIVENIGADDVDFCLLTEGIYHKELGNYDRIWNHAAGGLADLFAFIGECYLELSVGLYSGVRHELGDLVKMVGTPPYPRLTMANYFDYPRHKAAVIDRATTLYIAKRKEYDDGWRDYLEKADKLVENDVGYMRDGQFLKRSELPEYEASKPAYLSHLIRAIRSGETPFNVPVCHLKHPGFSHSADFHTCVKGGETYSLSSMQALAIKAYHDDFINGTPDVGDNHILKVVLGSKRDKLSLVFANKKDKRIFDNLIREGERKSTHRLNI